MELLLRRLVIAHKCGAKVNILLLTSFRQQSLLLTTPYSVSVERESCRQGSLLGKSASMDTWDAWVPVTNPKEFASSRDVDKLEINLSNSSLPFLRVGEGGNSDRQAGGGTEEPVEVIIFRVIFALLISISLVMNLLLILAILRIKCRVAVVYILLAYLVLPDLLFYIKLITELIHWDSADPGWASSDWSCGLWQFASHLYPLAYSVTLTAILYHAFITLYLDYKGDYEAGCRKFLPLLLLALSFLLSVICASSGFYSRARTAGSLERSDGRQHCDLAVPSIVGADTSSPEVAEISRVTYRLVYEIVLPYMIPLVLVAFPYVALLVGKTRNYILNICNYQQLVLYSNFQFSLNLQLTSNF